MKRGEIEKVFSKYKFGSGDLIYTNGKDKINRRVKSFFNLSWCHIGIILEWENEIYVLEALRKEMEGLNDYITGKPKIGVQLHKLSDKLESYGGLIGVRFLHPKLSKKLEYKMFEFYKSNVDVVWGGSWFHLLYTAIGDNERRKRKKEYYCSNFIAEVLQNVGLLDKNVKSWKFSLNFLIDYNIYGYTDYGYDDRITVIKNYISSPRNIEHRFNGFSKSVKTLICSFIHK